MHGTLQLAKQALFEKKIYKPINLPEKKGYVSFCFDDVHSTAFELGQAILDKHQIKATYYLSLLFLSSFIKSGDEPSFTIEQLRHALLNGHELACHTFSHLDIHKIENLDSLTENIIKNKENIEKLSLGINTFKNFAYPKGHGNLGYKKYLSTQFSTCRGTSFGINTNPIDADNLKAIPLYENSISLNKIEDLLKGTEKGGWLVFYTHDVRSNFSTYGCSPSFLQKVIELSLQYSVEISSVKEIVRLSEK